MKIIQPNVEFIPMPTDKASLLKHIERCGRVCYKSEDKITEGSAEQFIAGIIKRGHEAVLEHGAIILAVDAESWSAIYATIRDLEAETPFQSYLQLTDDLERHIVSGNIRAWRDYLKAFYSEFEGIPDFTQNMILKYPELFPEFVQLAECLVEDPWVYAEEIQISDLITENEKLHHQYQTLLFTCDRGVSHELVRHRPSSFCQESTRYCNYGKDGFGNEITVIEPLYLVPHTPGYRLWRHACEVSETTYLEMLAHGFTPQESRAVLPNSLKTELVMTAHMGEWRHVINLRCSKAAHPQAREVMGMGLGSMHSHFPELFEDQWEDFCDE
jgi:thymidylate synthase (FAD)